MNLEAFPGVLNPKSDSWLSHEYIFSLRTAEYATREPLYSSQCTKSAVATWPTKPNHMKHSFLNPVSLKARWAITETKPIQWRLASLMYWELLSKRSYAEKWQCYKTKQKKNPATINQSYQSCLTQIHDSKAFSKPCNSLSFNWELAILSKILTHCHLFRVWLDSHLGPTLPMEILLHLMEIDVKEGLQENRGLKIELSYTYSVGNFGMTRSWWSLFSYQ